MDERVVEWEAKLIGRKFVKGQEQARDTQAITEKDLPSDHRVLNEGGMATMDFKEERLNVQLDKDDKITKVYFG